MQEKRSDPDEEIDFRALVRSLLRAKWLLIGITVVAALLAFIISQRGAVKTYQARTMVVFGQAPLNLNLLSTTGNNFNPSAAALPDAKGITDLVTLDDIFVTVYQSPDLAASRQQGLTPAKIRQESSVSISGTNQLILRVSDPDPKQAVLLVNLWARAIADRLNTLYGSSNAQVTALQQQTQEAQQQWESAEKALVDYLPQSQVDGLSAQLSQAQAAYNSQLAKIHSIDSILSDGSALNGRLAGQPASDPVRTGDALTLIGLQQRAGEVLVCNVQLLPSISVQAAQTVPYAGATPAGEPTVNCSQPSGMPVQLSGTDVLGGVGTVGEAQLDLKLLMDSLQTQQQELQTSAAQSDTQLAQLHSKLESAQFQVEELETQRDLAKTRLSALSVQVSNAQAEVAANGSVARVVGQAGPAGLVGSKVVTNTLLVAVSAFIAIVALIWLREWWRSGSQAD